MKKLFLVILLTTLSANMFAGWSANERSRCRWWSNRFVARASVYTGLYYWESQGTCGGSYVERIKDCAWQQTRKDYNGTWQNGGVNHWFCSRGEKISQLEHLLLPDYKNTTNRNIEESTFKSQNADFNEASHSIIIKGISGKIKLQKGNGYYSNIRISVWKPNDDLVNFREDEIMDDSEVISQFEIKVADNGVFFNGKLAIEDLKNKFIITEINNEIFVNFTDISITVPISSELSLDDLAIRYDGDGAPDKETNLKNTVENTDLSLNNNNFKFNTFPNPTTDIFNIEFSNNLSAGNTLIEIYNSLGEKIKDVFNGNLSKDEVKNLEVNLSNFVAGKYFILIVSNEKKLIKQVVKN